MTTPTDRIAQTLTPFGLEREAVGAAATSLGTLLDDMPTPTTRVLEEIIEASGEIDAGLRLLVLGHALLLIRRQAHALTVFERAAKTGEGEVAAVAHLRVGEAMLGRENLARGQAVFRQAYAIPGVAGSLAGIYLADLHQRAGNQAAAIRVLNEVIEAGHEQSAPIASFRLGGLLTAQGDSEGAEAHYRAGFESGHPEAAPSCATNLGALLIQRREMQEAITLLQFAINSNHPDAAPKAAATLGMLMAGAGQRDHAIGLLNLAATRGDKETAAAAAIRLAGVLVDDGQVREARQVLQATVNMKHERWSPRAQEALQALDEGAAARRRTALRGRTAQRKPKTR